MERDQNMSNTQQDATPADKPKDHQPLRFTEPPDTFYKRVTKLEVIQRILKRLSKS